ncbi:unnamed protein product [Allacma fusca]|uniref:Peptidase S1 domain-containing protein n=1 Tax=Allacma fusca TaxID=39272 RepID=A0A8J2KLI6_9HEXA|nr:unnamed protein product [Allacma fusca]
MKIFLVAYLLPCVFTAFSDATPEGTSHRQRGPKGRMTPMQSKEAAPLVVGTEQVSGIDAAILHPKYDRRTMDYDYGVLRLSHNLTFNKYRWVAVFGGPLVCNGSLTGILSWGEFGCAEGKLPNVFASVGAERAWINSQ